MYQSHFLEGFLMKAESAPDFDHGHRQLRKSKYCNEIALMAIFVTIQRVPITSGEMVVTEIYFWDEVNHLLYFR